MMRFSFLVMKSERREYCFLVRENMDSLNEFWNGRNIIRNRSFQIVFFCKRLTDWNDNESCVFLLLCLFTTQNSLFYTHRIYKQEARCSLYSLHYKFNYTIKIIPLYLSHPSAVFPAPPPKQWKHCESDGSLPGDLAIKCKSNPIPPYRA